MNGLVDDSCCGCVYRSRLNGAGVKGKWNTATYCCDYILFRKVSRPCPAGAGCTVRKKRKRGKKPRHD